jgi:hypothetical protein
VFVLVEISRHCELFDTGTLPSLLVAQSLPYEGEGKSKVRFRTGHEGPQGEHMYSSTLPSTSALDVGGWSTLCPGHFNPG